MTSSTERWMNVADDGVNGGEGVLLRLPLRTGFPVSELHVLQSVHLHAQKFIRKMSRVMRFAIFTAVAIIAAYVGSQIAVSLLGAHCEARDVLDGYVKCNELGDIGYVIGLGGLPLVALAALVLLAAGVGRAASRIRGRSRARA